MKADNFIFEKEDKFGNDMIKRISKEMGVVTDCVDKIIVTIRYKDIKPDKRNMKKVESDEHGEPYEEYEF